MCLLILGKVLFNSVPPVPQKASPLTRVRRLFCIIVGAAFSLFTLMPVAKVWGFGGSGWAALSVSQHGDDIEWFPIFMRALPLIVFGMVLKGKYVVRLIGSLLLIIPIVLMIGNMDADYVKLEGGFYVWCILNVLAIILIIFEDRRAYDTEPDRADRKNDSLSDDEDEDYYKEAAAVDAPEGNSMEKPAPAVATCTEPKKAPTPNPIVEKIKNIPPAKLKRMLIIGGSALAGLILVIGGTVWYLKANSPEALYDKGVEAYNAQEYEKAASYLSRINDKSFAHYSYAKGWATALYDQVGKRDKAVKEFNKLLEVEYPDQHSKSIIGRIYMYGFLEPEIKKDELRGAEYLAEYGNESDKVNATEVLYKAGRRKEMHDTGVISPWRGLDYFYSHSEFVRIEDVWKHFKDAPYNHEYAFEQAECTLMTYTRKKDLIATLKEAKQLYEMVEPNDSTDKYEMARIRIEYIDKLLEANDTLYKNAPYEHVRGKAYWTQHAGWGDSRYQGVYYDHRDEFLSNTPIYGWIGDEGDFYSSYIQLGLFKDVNKLGPQCPGKRLVIKYYNGWSWDIIDN